MAAVTRAAAEVVGKKSIGLNVSRALKGVGHHAKTAVEATGSSASNSSRNLKDSNAQLCIGSILGNIVNKESKEGSPSATYSDPAQSKAMSAWSVVFEGKNPFQPKPDALFSEWLTYVNLLSPSTEANATLVGKIVQMLDAKKEEQLDSIAEKLSVQDIGHVLLNSRTPASAFMFYKWLRSKCFYIADKSVYTVLMERLFTSRDLDIWDQVDVVMRDMIKKKTVIESQQFERLLGLVKLGKTSMSGRMQTYLQWLFDMKSVGLVPLVSTYEKVMKLCNRLQMYEDTFSVFEAIPANTYCWAFTVALAACRCTDNLTLAEKLLGEMKSQNMKPDPKCCNDLLILYFSHEYFGKAENLLVEMKKWGIIMDLQLYTTVIHAYGKVGKVKQAEEIFHSIEERPDPGIFRAMAACYRTAGHFKELLALLRQGERSRIGATCFASAFEACVEKCEWKIALEIMKDMQETGMSPSPRLYPLILLACSKVNDYSVCKVIDLASKEMGMLSLEELECIIKVSVVLGNVPSALRAVEVINERELGPPTADLFEYCILAFSDSCLANAMQMYDVMRSVGHVPSSNVFTTLINSHIKAEDMLQSKKLYEEMVRAGFQPEEYLASLMLSPCKV